MRTGVLAALLIGAIPMVAVGQVSTECPGCTHAVSVYMGSGGLIATAEDGAEEVAWVARCGNTTKTDKIPRGTDGFVSLSFAGDFGGSGDDDLACNAEGGGTLELGPIKDGGWYWINDDRNSAVGGLVARDILENETVDVTDAGASVTVTEGRGANFLKHTSGRVGILPTIVPEPPPPPPVLCGPRKDPEHATEPDWYTTQRAQSCTLGDGGTRIRLQGPGANNRVQDIADGMVTRPVSGSIEVTADLWVNKTGSYSTDTSGSSGGPSEASVRKGWLGKTSSSTQSDHETNWLTATLRGSIEAAVSAPSLADAGVSLANSSGRGTFTISANADYCPAEGTQTTATLNINAEPGANDIYPPVATGEAAGLGDDQADAGFAAKTQLRIVCAARSSSANRGAELVPENPFPTDE